MQKLTLLTSLILSINIPLLAQPGNLPFPQEPGKCYAKCLILDQYETIEESFLIYTGELKEHEGLDSLYFKIDDNSGALFYLGYESDLDRWQIEEKESFEKIVFIIDSEEEEDYLRETISYKKLLVRGGGMEWKEVLCGDKVNGGTIEEVQKVLVEKGYLEGMDNPGRLTENVKKALRTFQKENGLPVGQLDMETLEVLGVRY